jgi:hypothetical protein
LVVKQAINNHIPDCNSSITKKGSKVQKIGDSKSGEKVKDEHNIARKSAGK